MESLNQEKNMEMEKEEEKAAKRVIDFVVISKILLVISILGYSKESDILSNLYLSFRISSNVKLSFMLNLPCLVLLKLDIIAILPIFLAMS